VDEPHQVRILADREAVEFSVVGVAIDSFTVRDSIEQGVSSMTLKNLQELATLFRGSFLEGLELPDYDRFQAWLVAEREDALARHVLILRAIVDRLSDNAADAVPYARLLVERDPLDERARSKLSGFLVRLGRHAEARQVIEIGKRLAIELGTGNSALLEKIERELPSHGAPDVPVHVDHVQHLPIDEALPEWGAKLEMIGRENEHTRVRVRLDRARDSRRGEVFLISGEQGIGKSRFLAELSAGMAGKGTVLQGRSYEAEARRPYGPWIDAIRSLHPSTMGDVLRDELSPLLTGLVREDDRQGGRDRLFAAIVELIAARAHSAPPVLLQFDDVQWCDEASAELLHYVVRMTRHRPVSVMLAARSGELPDNEPMMRVLRGFRRDRWIEEIDLTPLSRDDTDRLVRLISPDLNVESIFEESAGNPLYAIELARASNLPGDGMDSGCSVLIRDRIDRLPPSAGDVLRWAAVLGSTFSFERLASIVSLGVHDLTTAIEILDRHGLLRMNAPVANSPAFGFTHNIVRRSVYDDLSEPRRRLMHSRIAHMFEQEACSASKGCSTTTICAEIAYHAALAGDTATAARASAEAGRCCLRIYANGEAVSFARSGMRYSETLPEPERVGLQIELTEVSLAARRPRNVEETAAMLEGLSERALFHGDVVHARLGFHLLSYLRWERGDWPDARRHSLRAEFIARGANTKEQVVAMAEAARCLALLERDLGQAEALALEARARAAQAGVESVAISDALGMLRFHQGAWDDAAALFHQARELSQREGDRDGEFRTLEHLTVLELERNDAHTAGLLCRDLVALAGRLREGSEAPFARCLAALAADASGKDTAEEIDAAIESLRMADAKHRLAYALLRAARGDIERGNFDKARARGEEALRLARILERPSETAMAHVVLLRCALKGSGKDAARHEKVLQQMNAGSLAAHVRRAMEGVTRGTRTG
jgi:predicted ATPase